ncbi:hypothetical protein [Mycolicibacterium wolinskyi]|uniref:hypothetical protein n=1 Tax=Mycolicibacterium wolinskyi TaxID=59750 RepID=UPI003917B4A1
MKFHLSAVTDWGARLWRSRLGRLRTSTLVLIVAFIALSWVQQNYAPKPASTESPATQVVPPGFVPDPDYTWVPRTNVAPPRTTTSTTTPTTTPETTTTTEETPTTTSPTETTSPTSPATTTQGPQTTVVDPDGPGLLPPITLPVFPGPAPQTPAGQPQITDEPVAPAPPR